MDWFYDYEITIVGRSTDYDEDSGFYTTSDDDSLTLPCDVQPLDTTVDLDETGKLINAEYKVFLDKVACDEDSQVIYDDETYVIEKITDWTDYLIIYIRKVS